MDLGVTSTYSSPLIYSNASSRENCTGGIRRAFSSEPEARMLVSFFDLVTFTTRSLSSLEQWTGLRRKAAPGDCTSLPLPEDADMDDLMKQNEACRYLSCGKNTIKGYASRGLVHSYRKGKFTYYSRRELDKKIRKLRDTL